MPELKGEILILFQNADFLIVDKPEGLSVHNAEDSMNLLSVLEKSLELPKLFPVHRLDKETSGIQVLARSSDAARRGAEEFQTRSVQKYYSGILRGQVKEPEGVWKQSLTDKAEGRRNPEGQIRDRIPCETRFHAIKQNKYFSLCDFQLITGRQHQIRKHSAINKHAIVGDPRYGDPAYNKRMTQIYGINRMLLHCVRLEIFDQTITCPLPPSFARFFDSSS